MKKIIILLSMLLMLVTPIMAEEDNIETKLDEAIDQKLSQSSVGYFMKYNDEGPYLVDGKEMTLEEVSKMDNVVLSLTYPDVSDLDSNKTIEDYNFAVAYYDSESKEVVIADITRNEDNMQIEASHPSVIKVGYCDAEVHLPDGVDEFDEMMIVGIINWSIVILAIVLIIVFIRKRKKKKNK